MNKFALSILTTAALLTATAANAGGRYDYDDGYRQDERAYQRSNVNDGVEFAQVLSSRPVYRDVRVSEPRQDCYDERVVYRDDYNRGYSNNGVNSAVGTVVGGVIGGAIGHQFSRGSGRQIATAIGAVIGAGVGNNAANNSYGYDQPESRERVAYEPRCRTVQQTRYEQTVDGYDVTYRYQGRVYNTHLPYDPGARLAVQVNVSPAGY